MYAVQLLHPGKTVQRNNPKQINQDMYMSIVMLKANLSS